MLAFEQVSVINDLKGGKRETTEGRSRNNGAALGEGTGSSKAAYGNIPVSSAETQPHPGRGWKGAADPPHSSLLKLGLCGPADTILR